MEKGGWMKGECIVCDGEGFINENPTKEIKEAIKLDKRSSSYKQAVKDLIACGLSADEAHKKLSEAA